MKGWYRAAVDCAPPPARVNFERITAERVDLYHHVPSPGENFPLSVEPSQVKKLVPTDDDTEWAVKRLRNHNSGVTSRMRAEHLKGWFSEAQKEEAAAAKTAVAEETGAVIGDTWGEYMEEIRETENEEMTYWEKVVALVMEEFGEGRLAEESTW